MANLPFEARGFTNNKKKIIKNTAKIFNMNYLLIGLKMNKMCDKAMKIRVRL